MSKSITQSFQDLRAYLEKPPLHDRYKGYDPFDGLNSKIFQKTLLNNSRFFRLAWLQFIKRSPINFREISKVEIGYNPQAVALFILGYGKLYRKSGNVKDLEIIKFLSSVLLEIQCKGWSGSCWGYNFDWQARAFFQPSSTPMIVPTAYAVDALFEASDVLQDSELKAVAIKSADFALNDLNRMENDHGVAFSYSPIDKNIIYNASLLASRVLSKVYSVTGNESYKIQAKTSVDYCVASQAKDGSWTYGEKPYHQWIDNFHTGYNLECLRTYTDLTKDSTYVVNIENGLDYYLKTFFLDDGRSKYYSNQLFPIDINNPAQLVITLCKLGILDDHRELVNKVLTWTVDQMQSKKGYFYYQVRGLYKTKISYMRWSQAWMFYSLASLISELDG